MIKITRFKCDDCGKEWNEYIDLTVPCSGTNCPACHSDEFTEI